MGDFFNPHKYRIARKRHRCSYCAEGIEIGDQYVYQKGNWEGSWFESKMHEECFEDMCNSGDDEYILYCNERPTKNA